MRNSFKMLECRDNDEAVKSVDPSNSYSAFSSFVSAKSNDASGIRVTSELPVQEAVAETFVEAVSETIAETL